MRFPFASLVLLVGLLASAAWSQTPVPIGGEFQVNTYTTNRQGSASVAVQPAGDIVIAWNSNHGSPNPNTLTFDIQGKRYDAAGNMVGVEFLINTYTTGTQGRPEVSMDADGKFVVVWRSYGSAGTDSSQWSVQARRYDGTGMALGEEFQINTYTTSRQWNPSVAMKSDGGFVVVWESYGSGETDSSEASIQGRRFDETGTAVSAEFQVNTYTTDSQSRPSVAMGADGDFIVIWQSYGSGETDTSCFSIQGQLYDATATPVGGEFQVNTYTPGYQVYARVAATTDDGFVVVWNSYGSYGTDSGYGVMGQRYDETGSTIGGEFQVNSYTTSDQGYLGNLSVAAIYEGGFVVVWSSDGSYGTDSSASSVQGQRFLADTTPVGTQFQINSFTTSSQGYNGVAIGSGYGGDFVVAWDSYGSDGTDTDRGSIQAQRFASPIFTDGFESGDTSAWSSSVP